MTSLSFTHWPELREPRGRRYRSTWSALLERLSVPRVEAVKENIPGFALATFRDDRRSLANVEQVFAVSLDIDTLGALSVDTFREPGEVVPALDMTRIRKLFATTAAFVHTTWKSTIDAPRFRVFLLLSRPVSGPEYRRVFQSVAARAEAAGVVVDRNASDPSRLWFLPAIREIGCSFIYWRCEGKPVSVEWALAATPEPAAPAPPPPSGTRSSSSSPDVEARAEKYLDTCEPAISGSGGHSRTFVVAQKLVLGFELDEEAAYRLLCGWNQRCVPPWSAYELRRKVREAAKRGTLAAGSLRDRERSR